MAKLIYSWIMSLDGYIADQAGKFDCVPDTEVHTAINDLTRSVATFLLGRRMYEVLVARETIDVADQATVIKDFAQIWRAGDKVVYSTTLETASGARTRMERTFEPDEVRRLTATAEHDISIGGPNLAATPSKVARSTSTTCSSIQSSSELAHRTFPTTSASGSSCWASAALATALSSSDMPAGRK